jgi:hypothetical protein
MSYIVTHASPKYPTVPSRGWLGPLPASRALEISVADPDPFDTDPESAFQFMRIRIPLFDKIRIQILAVSKR